VECLVFFSHLLSLSLLQSSCLCTSQEKMSLQISHSLLLFPDVDISFATLVVLSGRRENQIVPAQSGMSVTLYVMSEEDDD
jgi:hypothetical protein